MFSPFGLGVLDIAVGNLVRALAKKEWARGLDQFVSTRLVALKIDGEPHNATIFNLVDISGLRGLSVSLHVQRPVARPLMLDHGYQVSNAMAISDIVYTFTGSRLVQYHDKEWDHSFWMSVLAQR